MIKKHSFIILSLFYCACNPFAPTFTDDISTTSLILTDQESPQNVMTNFAFAYNFKDSLVYSDIIDTTFLFISKDFDSNPVTDITWGRDTDLKTTAGLFKGFNTLNLVWGGTIYERFLDGEDSSLVELKQVFQLTLDGGIDIPTLNGEALFILRKNTSNQWKIIRWEDKPTF